MGNYKRYVIIHMCSFPYTHSQIYTNIHLFNALKIQKNQRKMGENKGNFVNNNKRLLVEGSIVT